MRTALARLERLEELAVPRPPADEAFATFTILTGEGHQAPDDGEDESWPPGTFTIRIDRATPPERGEDE
jgi:hypothetical protein